MSVIAPPEIAQPPRPEHDGGTGPVDENRALIEEARRRARRRHLRTGAIVLGAAVVVALAVGVWRMGGESATDQRDPAGGTSAAEASVPVADAGPDDLVASMWMRGRDIPVGDMRTMWLYLFGDGRVVTRSFLADRATGWFEQRLTPSGLALLYDAINADGRFDPGREAQTDVRRSVATVQVRHDGRLVVVDRGSGDADYDRALDRLATLDAWLPDDAWESKGASVFHPSAYAACGGVVGSDGRTAIPFDDERYRSRLPDDVDNMLAEAPTLVGIPPGVDLQFGRPGSSMWDSPCRVVTRAEAQRIADRLAASGMIGSTGSPFMAAWAAPWTPVRHVLLEDERGTLYFAETSGSGDWNLEFRALLPHGVPEPIGLD